MSNNEKSQPRQPVISIQVINVTCPCGGGCENENGSTMIEYFDKVVWCTWCSAQYEVPASAWQKTFLVKDLA